MDIFILPRGSQGLSEREESQGGGGQLELCEEIPGVDDQHRIGYDIPLQVESLKAEPADCHPGHTTTHRRMKLY